MIINWFQPHHHEKKTFHDFEFSLGARNRDSRNLSDAKDQKLLRIHPMLHREIKKVDY